MGFAADQLRDKALLALEEAVQECRWRTPRRTFLLRFALAYLWTRSGGDRGPFDSFWAAMGEPKRPWSFSTADHALNGIYRALGVERPDAIGLEMWRRQEKVEGGPARHSGGEGLTRATPPPGERERLPE